MVLNLYLKYMLPLNIEFHPQCLHILILKVDLVWVTFVHPCFQIALKESTFFILICIQGTLHPRPRPNIFIHILTLLLPCNLSWLWTKSMTIKRITNGLRHWGVTWTVGIGFVSYEGSHRAQIIAKSHWGRQPRLGLAQADRLSFPGELPEGARSREVVQYSAIKWNLFLWTSATFHMTHIALRAQSL